MAKDSLFELIQQTVLEGEVEKAAELARKGLDEGLDPLEIINKGFVPAMDEAGARFSDGRFFLPELVAAAEAMKEAMGLLEPLLGKGGAARESLGRVVIGTVEGDIHDIGKSIVASLLTANGFEVRDLGVDVPVGKFVEEAKSFQADIVGLSALLTTTMPKQREVLEALQKLDATKGVKVMVGGAPVTARWAEEIGADGYAEDAVSAVLEARKLVGA